MLQRFNDHMPTVVCSVLYTGFISKDGTVFSCGCCFDGEHGHDEKIISNPTAIPTLKNIISISSGSQTVCLDNDGNVYTFGSNEYGKLGIGVDEDTLKFTHIPQKVNLPPCKQISCGYGFIICLTEDGLLCSFGDNNCGQLGLGSKEETFSSPQKIESLNNVEFIECGGCHTFCKTCNNEIFCWGNNELVVH